MKSQKEITLFSRYKNMINNLWEDGQRKYTANELNTFVGHYENSTWWKRMNNNPFYTTRTYQTALKHLGCITKIKRGLWQINGPIPEWFGSFHMNALTNTGALKELEKSSIYWQSLLAEHKVNPWKAKMHFYTESIDDDAQMEDDIAGGMRNCGDTDYYKPSNTNTMNKTTDCVMQTIAGLVFFEELPQLTMNVQISIYPKEYSGCRYGVDICDWQYHFAGKPISESTATDLCKAYNKEFDVVRDAVFHKVTEDAYIIEEGFKANGESEKYYSETEVKQIVKSLLEDFSNGVKNRVNDAIDELLDGYKINIDINNSI